ncbi:hypothetical protein NDU88_007390 [Pleurodeles waltl]|uniref:Uncharacterized protein n=1 Tax=Pleurodeles waltl TaxID=8319 RepID=A0AAV7N577_PLEWA|nr:hypothetical protein NDU88_007390 [Pleurodeles waltl]
MVPKIIQNFGDKGEGARLTRAGKDSGDAAPAGRRPASGATKLCGKNTCGTAKNGKNATGVSPQDSMGKDKSQPVITCFLTGGTQERETRAESRRARITTKRLQDVVHKVAKSCTEIKEKLNIMEDRTTAVEVDVEALKEQLESHGGQLTDIMWILEDQENRQRRNNLCFFGIEEGVEGNDVRVYMIKTLRGAAPELINWDWEIEIQRAHRFPRVRCEGGRKVESKYPTAILFFWQSFVKAGHL